MFAAAVCALLIGAPADAQTPVTVVVPNAQAASNGNSSNVFPFNPRATGTTSIRYQQVYRADAFPAGRYVISQIAFRAEGPNTPFSGTTGTLQVDLSTTSAAPDALSTTFANNLGTNTTTVFNGQWTLSTANNNTFDLILTLSTPFTYDTSQGNLLLDVRNFGGGDLGQLNNTFVFFDAQSTAGDAVSRVYTAQSLSGVGLAEGVADPLGSLGLVTRFTAEFLAAPAPPGPPTTFQATVSGNFVNMSWGPPATGGAPTAYTIRARLTPGGPVVASLPVGLATSHGVTAPNGTFSVSVVASNADGAAESPAVTITVPQAVPAPGAPANLAVSVAGNTATFTWDGPTTGGAVATYVLVAGVTPAFTAPIASVTLPAATGTVIPGVPPGTFYVRVHAVNGGGTSPASNEATLTVAGPTPPGAPTLNAPVVAGNTVSLSWSAGSGGTPTGYTLIASLTPGGAPLVSVPLGGTSVAFNGVPSGTYFLRLTASNAAGPSPPSAEVTVVVP